MAYRTYRNLYRIRPSLSSIGQGQQRIRLPRGVQLTMDVAILTLVLWLPCSLTAGYLIASYFPVPSFFAGFFVSGLVSYQLGKLDPSGKTMLAFVFDFVGYIFRSKFHDGFENQRKLSGKVEPVKWSVKAVLMEDNRIGSLPAKGRVRQFQLLLPAAVKVKRGQRGQVVIQHRGKKFAPGVYEVKETGKIVSKREPPKLGKH